MAPAAVFGEVQVRGTPDAVRIEAQGESIEDVLAALRKAFDLRWQSPTALDKRITGTYEGSLNRALTRVLDGYNFVLKASSGRLEVTVLGPRGTTAIALGAGAPAGASATTPAKVPPKPSPSTGPVLAAAVSKTVGETPPALVPTLIAATNRAEMAAPVPGQGAELVKPPEPIPSTVPPPMPGQGTGAVPELKPSAEVPQAPMPGQGTGAVPELKPSAVLPPGASAAPPVPDGAAPPSDAPPAPPKTQG
jgi:hypothetical protein